MRFLYSVKYAIQGIKYCIVSEKNFRIQVAIALLACVAGLICKLTLEQWLVIAFCSALVLSLEMVNSSIEKLSDYIITDMHPTIKQVKDIAAGAVLVASISSFIIGCIIFVPKLLLIIKHFTK